MKSKFLYIIISALFIVACGNKAKAEEIEGRWVVINDSWQNVPSNLKMDSTFLVLHGDQTFTAKNLPGLFFIPPGSIESNSGIGNWSFITVEGNRMVQLEFITTTGNQNVNLPYGTQLNISKGISGLNLYYYLGDPDGGKRVKLKKMGNYRS